MLRDSLHHHLSFIATLLTLHRESPFKIKAFNDAANLVRTKSEFFNEGMDETALCTIKGIGTRVAGTIVEYWRTGTSSIAAAYLEKTPIGLLEILNSVRGLGIKKLLQLHEELGVETLEDLLRVTEDNSIEKISGIGRVLAQKIKTATEFALANRGWQLYAAALAAAHNLLAELKTAFPSQRTEITGALRRQTERCHSIHLLSTIPLASLFHHFSTQEKLQQIQQDRAQGTLSFYHSAFLIHCKIQTTRQAHFTYDLFLSTGSKDFLEEWNNAGYPFPATKEDNDYNEAAFFTHHCLPFLPPPLREKGIWQASLHQPLPLIENTDIKGIIHAHTHYSDGQNSLEDMALAARDLGMEYIVVSDHSQSSVIAGGLSPQKIQWQHEEIDALNERLAPFKIFKSIECDILLDGSLDYDNPTLAWFDIVIIAIHQQLDMEEAQAMQRLLKAISHPYANILAHPTGRLINRRAGYPIDYEKLFTACAEHQVCVEINASPARLDLDWRYIPLALQKGLILSINPDAHSISGLQECKWGISIAQKGGLYPNRNLSSFSRVALEKWISKQHKKRNPS